MIRVDNHVYTWMGDPVGAPLVTQTGFSYTSTKSIFTMDVGGMVEMTITFTSPLTPNDLKRQSLIFSYMEVAVASLDGSPHYVQLYSDISAGKPSTLSSPVHKELTLYRMGHRRSWCNCTMGHWSYRSKHSFPQSLETGTTSVQLH